MGMAVVRGLMGYCDCSRRYELAQPHGWRWSSDVRPGSLVDPLDHSSENGSLLLGPTNSAKKFTFNKETKLKKSYGNTGTPITMDMGGFEILYREPNCGGNRRAFHKTSTMLQAVAEFNTIERTSGFDTPLRITRNDIFGNRTHTWTMDGRYDTPRLIGTFGHEEECRRERRRYRRYSNRSGDRG